MTYSLYEYTFLYKKIYIFTKWKVYLTTNDQEKIWFNGKNVDWKNANIHILNHGLHYASCVFEGERVYDGEIFKLEEHTERLFSLC